MSCRRSSSRQSAEPSAGPDRALPDILIWDITAVQILPGEGKPNGGYTSAVRSHGRIRLTCCRGDALVTGIIRPLT